MMSTNNGNHGTVAVDASHLYQQKAMEDEQNAASSVPTGNSGKGSTSSSDAVAVTINNNNNNNNITADNDHESLQTTAMAIATARKNERRRIALFVFACLYTFLFVGSFFGWGPMQLLVSA